MKKSKGNTENNSKEIQALTYFISNKVRSSGLSIFIVKLPAEEEGVHSRLRKLKFKNGKLMKMAFETPNLKFLICSST